MTEQFQIKSLSYTLISISFGIWSFLVIQPVIKDLVDPMIAACLLSKSDFETSTNYQPYERRLGGPHVCLQTQFAYDITKLHPIGLLIFGIIILTCTPGLTLINAEAGRSTAKGLLRYPSCLILLCRLIGIGVVFPIFWLPSYVQTYKNEHKPGPITPFHAYTSAFTSFVFSVGYVLIFFILDNNSYAWTVTVGVVLGPIAALTPLLLWSPRYFTLDFPTTKHDDNISAKGCFTLAKVYLGCAVLSFVLWIIIVYVIVKNYYSDISLLWKEIWIEPNPAIYALRFDFAGLFLGIILYVAYISNLANAMKVLLMSLFLGPGTSCSLMLSWIEKERGRKISALQESNKLD